MNFVCVVFELCDKMLTLSSMENLIVPCNLEYAIKRLAPKYCTQNTELSCIKCLSWAKYLILELKCIRMGRRGLQSSRSVLKDTDVLHSTSAQSCTLA